MRRRLSDHARRLLFTLILTVGACIPDGGFAATDVFVRIPELGACGSSIDDNFRNDIVALGFTEGINQQLDENTGLPTGAKKVARGLTLIKIPDGCSPLVFLATLNGQRLSVHVFFVQVGPNRVVTSEIIATDVLVTSMTTDFKTVAQEVVQFGIAGSMTILTRGQNPDGSPQAPVARCWNFASNSAC